MIRVLNIIDSLYAGGAESLPKNFLIEAKNTQILTLILLLFIQETFLLKNFKITMLGYLI